MKGIVPNIAENNMKITFQQRGRRGLLCNIPILNRVAMARYKSLKDNALCVRGPKLFNTLPCKLRDLNISMSAFKRKLDNILERYP